jgi:threonine/homoserine/homoserine lactone efflux protein
VLLGTVFNATGTAWNILVAIATARLAGVWKVSRGTGVWLERGLGAMFVALGARLALLKQA